MANTSRVGKAQNGDQAKDETAETENVNEIEKYRKAVTVWICLRVAQVALWHVFLICSFPTIMRHDVSW